MIKDNCKAQLNSTFCTPTCNEQSPTARELSPTCDLEQCTCYKCQDNNYVSSMVNRLQSNASTSKSVVTNYNQCTRKDSAFRRFAISDVVFLAIMSACMLLTGAIMPLITQVPLFGIIQLCLGLQFSIFPAIGLMKVRKIGTLTFMALFSGIVLVFMFPPMFVCLLACAIFAELFTVMCFGSYNKNASCVVASALYMPLTLPFLYLWIKFFYTVEDKLDAGQAVNAYVGGEWWLAVAMSVAVVIVCLVGALIGVKIAKELNKAGVIKK